jgi:malate dehydrogenase (oxaloacetate-decarboxylating)(NADP+)
MIQFEDFSSDKAMDVLNRYRGHHLVFNDDIQGTGAVAVAGILSALRQQGKSHTALADQRIVIAGAGSAGLGVASALHAAMVMEGLSPEEASKNFWICDINGVLSSASSVLAGGEKFKRTDATAGMSIAEVIPVVKPTILLGLSAVKGLFTDEIVRMMGEYAERPIIFPLSNPTNNAECTAEDAYRLTDGRVIFASGSPFDPVTIDGRTFVPSQCNNMFIFPGLGLGATICKASQITDKMIHQTAITLADSLTDDERARGQIFPSVKRIRDVSRQIAVTTIVHAVNEGLVHETTLEAMPSDLSVDNEMLHLYVARRMYDPVYTPLVDKVYTTI